MEMLFCLLFGAGCLFVGWFLFPAPEFVQTWWKGVRGG